MALSTIADVLTHESFVNVLETSPFASRADVIRSTLREVHHQYLEQKLSGQPIGPAVDYGLLEEVAYYLSGVAITPGRSNALPATLQSQMLAVAALIFEYLGDVSATQVAATSNLEPSALYYLDASICNTLGCFEANTIALARKHLAQQRTLDELFTDSNAAMNRDSCQNVLYIWLARDMSFLWIRHRRIEESVALTISDSDVKLSSGQISRYTYSELRYWIALAEAITLHARFFQFGKQEYLELAGKRFVNTLQLAKRLDTPPLVWLAYALQMCADRMGANSVWSRLSQICPSRYVRRLVTSAPPILELWTSQIAALDVSLQDPANENSISLDGGLLDPRIRRVVIGMPTSAGKTLLAELAIIRLLFPDVTSSKPVSNVTCVYVVPSIALANQIEEKLRNRLLPLGIRATAVLGGYDTTQLDEALFTKTRVAVLTPEKLDMLVRQNHEFIQRCGLYIFDEVHKVNSPGRGFTLEVLITWLKDFHPKAKQAKMIFMSAIIPNHLQMKAWIAEQDLSDGSLPALSISEPWQPTRQTKGFFEIDKNDLIQTIEKPPLTESWYGGHLNYVSDRSDLAQPRQIRRLIQSKQTIRHSKTRITNEAYTKPEPKESFGVEENAAEIAKRFVAAKLDPVLVFFISRDETRTFCSYLAKTENYAPTSLSQYARTQYEQFIEYLRERLGAEHPLATLAERGIGYHHGWLPRDVRAEIEYAFANRWIRVLASTTTLTDGVNFPISTFILANYERVIGTEERAGRRQPITMRLDEKDFKNMIGRAGRAVYDTEGQIVFMIPEKPITPGITWQNYLLGTDNDSSRQVVSSLSSTDFRSDILRTMLQAMQNPDTAVETLVVDPGSLEDKIGHGAREVGETILRLQAFLLALADNEVLDPENFDTVLRFFERTLFGQLQKETDLMRLVTEFAQKTNQLMVQAEPDQQRRSIYSKMGLGFTSCQKLYAKANEYWSIYGRLHFSEDVGHLTEEILTDIGGFIFSLPETKPEPAKVPHTKPTIILDIPDGEVLSKWVLSQQPVSAIRDNYFKDIPDLGERAEACANYVRDAFEYKAPWVLSAFCQFVTRLASIEVDEEALASSFLARQLSMLPAYAKFGVNNPAAAFFSMVGVAVRRVTIVLGEHYNQTHPDRYYDFSLMLDWLLELEPEQVTGWIQDAQGEDKSGQVSRLFRFLDLLRSREQTLEDILPLEITIAGWQYYQGPTSIQEQRLIVGDAVVLKLDPLNPWDTYAVEVRSNRGAKLGFIPRSASRAVYNHLSSGLLVRCSVLSIEPRASFRPVTIKLDNPEG